MNQEQKRLEQQLMQRWQKARREHSQACKDFQKNKREILENYIGEEYDQKYAAERIKLSAAYKKKDAEERIFYTSRAALRGDSLDAEDTKLKLTEALKLLMSVNAEVGNRQPSATDLAKIDDLKNAHNPNRESLENLPWAKEIINAVANRGIQIPEEDPLCELRPDWEFDTPNRKEPDPPEHLMDLLRFKGLSETQPKLEPEPERKETTHHEE